MNGGKANPVDGAKRSVVESVQRDPGVSETIDGKVAVQHVRPALAWGHGARWAAGREAWAPPSAAQWNGQPIITATATPAVTSASTCQAVLVKTGLREPVFSVHTLLTCSTPIPHRARPEPVEGL